MGAKPSSPQVRPVVLDSDVLIAYLRGLDRARSLLEDIRYSQRLLSAVVFMELMHGARDRAEKRRILRFVDGSFGRIVHVTDEMSRRATALVERHTLAHRVAPTDALVAATALTLKATLATGNVSDFRMISGLRILPFRP